MRVLKTSCLFLGQEGELTLGAAIFLPDEVVDAGLDGAEIGEGAAEPTLVDPRLVCAGGFGRDSVLRLLLGADEEHLLAGHGDFTDKLGSRLKAVERLLEINDVDAVALREHERLHLGMPAAGGVSKMDSGLQQGLHRDFRLITVFGSRRRVHRSLNRCRVLAGRRCPTVSRQEPPL